MAPDLQRLIALCQSSEPSLEVQVNANWGSDSVHHRQTIRSELAKAHPPDDNLEDLSLPPRPRKHSVSISHTIGLGGFVRAARPCRVGFDVEQSKRLEASLHSVKRIAQPEELKLCPDLRLLWTAKESLYKALEHEQPATISMVAVGNWRSWESKIWAFTGVNPNQGQGFSLITEDYIYSIYILS